MITPHASPATLPPGSSLPLPELPDGPVAAGGPAPHAVAARSLPTVVAAPPPAAQAALATAKRTSSAKPSKPSSSRPASTRRTSGAGYAPKAASSRSASTKSTPAKSSTKSKSSSSSKSASAKEGPLAFLSDPKLTVDEKLFRLCLYAADKYDKALEKKMKELQSSAGGSAAASGTSKSGGSTSTKKKSGLLGELASAVKTVAAPALQLLQVKEVEQVAKVVAGPVLAAGATALGFPQAAPVLLKAGPQIVAAAKDLSNELDRLSGSSVSGSGSAGGGSSASGGSASSSTGDLPQIEQKQMMELQYLSEKQREMFGMVSNLLGSMHQTRMAIINNLRA